MRLRLLAILCLLGTAAFAPSPRPVEVVSGDATVAAQLEARAAQLAECKPRTRATFIRTRIKLRWNARGEVRSVSVGGPGGAAFARCVSKALRGSLVEPPARAGSGSAVVILRRAVVRKPDALTLPATRTPALQRCTVDADCVIHFQSSACIAGDPVAVNGTDMAAVRAAYPVRRLDCGMGGPQYDRLRMQNEGRYSAACEARQCVVRDAGPRPAGPVDL
ncbi:MAG TPA: hypothetical protein VM261_17665 [Kofleriaceae bacterium]|nr:hypothetical protein [Kofleriaceae bacterium]